MDRLSLLLAFLIITSALYAQKREYNFSDKEAFEEKMIIKTNDCFFIPGEKVFFTIHNSLKNGEPSFISKIAYIELIDSKRKPMLRTMVVLENGYGYGHIYLPSHLKTQDYSLIAYTSWMRNYNHAHIPGESIKIVNPYEPLPVKPDTFSISLFPEGGKYSKGENNILFTSNKPFEARIIDPAGEALATFSDKNNAYGLINLNLKDTGNYKIIITDANDSVYFQDLAIDELLSFSLAVIEGDSLFNIGIRNAGSSELTIYSVPDQITVDTYTVDGDKIIPLPKEKLPKGLLKIVLENDGKQLERLIFNAPEILPVEISTDKIKYSKREKAGIKITSSEELSGEKVVVQVRKKYGKAENKPYPNSFLINGLAKSRQVPAFEGINNLLISQNTEKSSSVISSIQYLPDFRGQLVSGKIKNGGKQEVMLSLPENHLYATKTNSAGEFQFHINGVYGENDLVIKTSGADVVIDDPFILDHSFVRIHPIPEDETMMEWLERKSIDVQVENAYYQYKQDSVVSSGKSLLKDEVDQTYFLDDYTRFPKTEDIFVEIIEELRLRQDNGRQKLIMPYIENPSGNVDSALILINGIKAEIDFLLNFNPLLIEKVELIKSQVKIGTAEYRGVVNFVTFDESAFDPSFRQGYKKADLQSPQPKYIYFQPDHSLPSRELEKIPDFRNQLLWEPEVVLEKGNSLSFFTSDLTGTYEVVVYGISRKGKLIYGKREVLVGE